MTSEAPLPVGSLHALDGAGRGLRVEFLRSSDRYAHRVLAIGCEEMPILLLESIEGMPGDARPPSPALQALNIDDLDDLDDDGETFRTSSRPAMLVGMSGKSHWSLSIEASGGEVSANHSANRGPGESAPPPAAMILFDAACRSAGAEVGPASRYSLGPRTAARPTSGGIDLDFGPALCQIVTLAGQPGESPPACQVDAGKRRIGILLEPGDTPAGNGPPRSTLRWRYALSLRLK